MIRKKFDIVSRVHLHGYKRTTMIIGWLSEGLITLKEFRWNDKFKQDNPEMYPIKLEEQKFWSTFDKCVDVIIKNVENGTEVNVELYDGNNFSGERTNRRFSVSFHVVSDDIFKNESVKEAVERNFNNAAEDLYEEREEDKKIKKLNKIKEELLS